jgi:type III pantothenate kinase
MDSADLLIQSLNAPKHELGEKLSVIATGGLSTVIAPFSKYINEVDPMLTLDGLVQISHFAEQKTG